MHKRSQGFSPLEIILAVAVIGLVGAVAWMFVSNQNTKDASGQSASSATDKKSESKKSDTSADRSAEWFAWQPSGKQYSIKFADGWSVYMKEGVPADFYTHGSLELKQGTLAKVFGGRHDENAPLNNNTCEGEGGVVMSYMDYTYPTKWYTGNETTLKTNAGLDIKKSVALPSDESQGIPTNDTTYSYVLSAPKESVMISYTKCKNGTDRHELVEQVVKTFEF